MHNTEAALMARGVDQKTAQKLRRRGWSLGKLQAVPTGRLTELGLNTKQIANIHAGPRPAIPYDTLVAVCTQNRWTCCVCREQGRSIVVHHIKEWAKSRNHSASNLAILCLEHHGEAHTTRQLGINLTPRQIKAQKSQWESRVKELDVEASKYLPIFDEIQWYYFNHQRIFELARDFDLDLKEIDGYKGAFTAGLITEDGNIRRQSKAKDWIYQGSYGTTLYKYTKSLIESLWSMINAVDVSDHLDVDEIPALLWSRFIFVQGAHTFKSIGPKQSQAATVKRSANNVEIQCAIDRWEATSCSSWSSWLRGRQSVGLLIRVQALKKVGKKTLIQGTALAICAPIPDIAHRRYDMRLLKSGVLRRRR